VAQFRSRIFQTNDPYHEPVSPEYSARRLGFGLGYCLSPEQEANLASALHGRSTSVVVHELEGEGRSWCGAVGSGLYEQAFSAGFTCSVETLIEAKDGTWGIMTASEDFAVLAGEPHQVEGIAQAMPEFSGETLLDGLREWRSAFEANPRASSSWVALLLRHIYGEQAGRLFEATGWIPLSGRQVPP
jgi:hypothetical protein